MSVNRVILLGHLGKDPEVRHLDNGMTVASFSLATTEKGYTTKSGLNVEDRTEWHNVVLWKGLAEVAEKYLKKGDKVYIEGKIRTRSYEDANKVKKYVTEIFGDNMDMLTTKREDTPQQQPQHQAPQQQYSNGEDLPF